MCIISDLGSNGKNGVIMARMERLKGISPSNIRENVKSLATSAGKGYASVIVYEAVKPLVERFGIKVGNANMTEKSMRVAIENPEAMLISTIVIGPAIEEAICRFIPQKIMEARGIDDDWKIQTAVSAAFSLWHNVILDEDKPRFDTSRFHLSAFVNSYGYWDEQKKHGYLNAFVRHAARNSAPAIYMYRKFKNVNPEEREELIKLLATNA